MIAQSQFLTDRANRDEAAGTYEAAVLLALSALPDEKVGQKRPYVPEAMKPLYAGISKLRLEGVFQGKPERVIEPNVLTSGGEFVHRVKYDPTGRTILAATDDGTIRLWRGGQDSTTIRAFGDFVHDFGLSP